MIGGRYRGLAVAVTILSVTMALVFPQQLYAEESNGETTVLVVQFKGVDDPVRIQVLEKIAEETLSDLRLKEDVLFAERVVTYKSVALPANDAYFSEQWYLWKIGAPEVWEKTIGDSKVIVAVLDTGVDIEHVDLRDNIWVNTKESDNGRDSDGNGYIDDIHGWNFIENNNNVRPPFDAYTENGINHGTLIAGEIGAKGGNGQGVSGVNWRVSMMPVRVLTSSGMGDVVNVVKGINYAIRNGAHVINLSFTGINNSAILTDAIRRAHDAGILVVAAAGNDDALNGGVNLTDRPAYPVCSDGPNGENWVVGVAATDEQDRKAPFSAYGDCIDISAPGMRVFSTKLYEPSNPRFTQRYGGLFNGTSLASPLVAGSAALLKAYNPGLTMLQIRDILIQTADSIDAQNPNYHGKLGKGRINVLRAMYSAPTPNGDHTGVRPTNSVEQPRLMQAPGSTTGIVTSAGTGLPPEVSVYLKDGSRRAQFLAYSEKFLGGVRTAVGDVDGDGNLEIVTAPGASGGPHVRVFNLGGRLESEFFAYEPKYSGGLSVAVGDTDGDGIEEIVVSPIGIHVPEVRVFDSSGNQKTCI